jgi:hypothetical protein
MYERPTVHETPLPKAALSPDDFAVGLTLNYDDIEPENVADYAKTLSKAGQAASKLAMAPQSNVVYLEDYRHGTTPEAA